jgi:hypothetical protein
MCAMPCGCLEYECLKVYLVPCAETVPLGIVSDYTGTVKMVVEFDNAHTRTDIAVTEGEAIVAPNVFNEDYNHLVQFFKPDGTLINDTCYKIKTMQTIFTNPPTPTPTTVAWNNVTDKPEDIINLSDILADLQTQIDNLNVDAVKAITNGTGQMPAGNTFPEAIPADNIPVAVLIGTITLANEEIGTGLSELGEPVTVTLTNYSVYAGQQITILYQPSEI